MTYEPSVPMTEEDEEFTKVLKKNRGNGIVLKNENFSLILTTFSFLFLFF